MTSSDAVLQRWKLSFYYWLGLLGDALGLLKVKEWWSEWRFKKKLRPQQPIERFDSLGWAGIFEEEVPEIAVEETPQSVIEEVQQDVVAIEEEPEVLLMMEPIKGLPYAPAELPWNEVMHPTTQLEDHDEPLPIGSFLRSTILPESMTTLEPQDADMVLH